MRIAALFCMVIVENVLHHHSGYCEPHIRTGYQMTLAVPSEYSEGFVGRAFLIESAAQTQNSAPSFRAALSVEAAIHANYSCSLQVFLGEVKVWSSGHYSTFYVTERCVLELTPHGDLRLKGSDERVGWRTGTSTQGVQRLRMMETGNLALLDAFDTVKWQSFNFPTDVMLYGQSLNVATRLTSFPNNNNNATTFYYSFEIENNKIALYLNSGKLKYSYWELQPASNTRNLSYVKLSSNALELFNDQNKKIAEIPSQGTRPLKFLSLGNKTGNLGLYYYSPEKAKFEASFQALNTTCDLPMACRPYGICTFSNSCSCVGIQLKEDDLDSDCGGGGIPEESCGKFEMEMLELEGISSVLRDAPKRVSISKHECSSLCLEDCKCAAALYSAGRGLAEVEKCYLYRVVMGIKQTEKGSGLSYMVKVEKGVGGGHGKSNLKKWIFVLVGVVDALVILLVLGGIALYLIRKRRKNLILRNADNN